MSKKHGRCIPCRKIFEWNGTRPLVRDALCPDCRTPLSRTCASLVKRVAIVERTPLEKAS
jgi:predicted amidophosphoribosyltransferase